MPLAFAILAHKNPRQVQRLFEVLYAPGDMFMLHFDRRAGPALHRLGRDLARRHGNVIVLRSRAVNWGGWRMGAVQIEAMAAALAASDRWHHFINLTGQDFPIRPRQELEARLQSRPHASYVSWFDPVFSPRWKNARERLAFYHLEWPWLDPLLRLPGLGRRLRRWLGWQNTLPHVPRWERVWPDFRYFGGANHVILSRAACAYVSRDPDARRITRWLKHSAHANEIVFPSVMLNGPLAATVINTHLHELDFGADSCHPRTLTISDFDRLARSPRFFARKFDETVDSAILDQLEAHVRPGSGRQTAAHR